MDATIFSLLIESIDRGDVKSLVLSRNLFHQVRYLIQLVWNVHIEKKKMNNCHICLFNKTGYIKWILKWKLFKKV